MREAGSIFLINLRIFATFLKLLLCGLAMNLAIRIVVDFNVKSNRLLTLLLALDNNQHRKYSFKKNLNLRYL